MNTETEFTDNVEFFDYLKVVIKRRWLIIIGTFFCVFFTGLFSILLDRVRTYEAKTVVLTGSQSDYLETGIDGSMNTETIMDTYIEIIGTKEFGRKIVEKNYFYTLNGEKIEGNLRFI